MPVPHRPLVGPLVGAAPQSAMYELSPYERSLLGPPDTERSASGGPFKTFPLECGAVVLGACAAIACLVHSLGG